MEAVGIARLLYQSEETHLTGVYMHDGNTYHGRGGEEVKKIANDTIDKGLQFRER